MALSLNDGSLSEIQFVEVRNVKVISPVLDRRCTVTIKDRKFVCCFHSSASNTTLETESGTKSFVQIRSTDTTITLGKRRNSRKSEIFEAPLAVGNAHAGTLYEVPLSADPDVRVALSLSSVHSAMDVAQKRAEEAEDALERVKGSMRSLQVATTFLKFFIDLGSPLGELHPVAKMAFGIGKEALTRITKVSKEYESLKGAALECILHLRFDDEAKRVFESISIQNVYKNVLNLTLKTLTLVSNYYSKAFVRRIISREAVEIDETVKALNREREILPNLFATEIRAFLKAEAEARRVEYERAEAARKLVEEESRLAGAERRRSQEAEKRRERAQEDSKLRDLLSATDSLQYGKSKCLPGTRIAVLEQLWEWSEDSDTFASRLFWLYGVAGCGKSTIASSIAHSLKDHCRLAGSFFCARDKDQRRSVMHLLGQLAFYLARSNPAFRSALLESIDHPDFKTVQDPKAYFVFVLAKPLAQTIFMQYTAVSDSVIVIDALDECDDPSFAAGCVVHIVNAAPWVKVIVTSRNLQEIRSKLSNLPSKTTYDLFDRDAREDIRLLLFRELEPDGRLKDIAEDILIRADTFVERSQGLFVWMNTMVEFIRKDVGNLNTVKRIIDEGSFPKAEESLDALYRIVVESASEGPDTIKELTRYVLAFVVASSSSRTQSIVPMSSRVIHALLPSIFEVRQVSIDTILDRLSPILTQYDDSIVAVHTSVLDFLSDDNRCGEAIWIDPVWIQRELARGCLEVMLHGTRNSERHEDTRDGLRFNPCQFDRAYAELSEIALVGQCFRRSVSAELQYSSLSWAEHVSKGWKTDTGESIKNEDILGLIQSLLESEKSLFWLEAVHLVMGGLCYVTRFGESADQPIFLRFKNVLLAFDEFGLHFKYEPHTGSTPQLYTSLTWIADDSPLRIHWKHYVDHFHVWERTELVGNQSVQVQSDSNAIACNLRGHTAGVRCVAFSPDGKHIVSGSDDGTAKIWDARTGRQVTLILRFGKFRSVAFAPDGKSVATYLSFSDNVVQLWDPPSGNQLHKLSDEDGLSSFAYHPDGSVIVTGSESGSLLWWDVSSGEEIERLKAHDGSIWQIAISRNGTLLASAGEDRSVQVRDARTKNLLAETNDRFVDSLVFSPDGRQLAVCTWYGTHVWVWDPREQEVNVNSSYKLKFVGCIVFSPDGKHIYGSRVCTIHCFDAQTGREVGFPLNGHSNSIKSIAVSMDGTRLTTGSDDKSIRTWDISTFQGDVDLSMVKCGTREIDKCRKVPIQIPSDGWIRAADEHPLLWVPDDYQGLVCDVSLLVITELKDRGPIRIDWEKTFRISGKNWPGKPVPQGSLLDDVAYSCV